MLAEAIRRRSRYERTPIGTLTGGSEEDSTEVDLTGRLGSLSKSLNSENTASGSPSGSLPIDGNFFSTPARRKMSTVAKVKAFRGTGDGKENVKYFIDDVEFAAETHEGKEPASAKTMIRIFRQHLEEDAYEYWCSLEDTVTEDWEKIKQLFMEKFSKTTTIIGKMELINSVLSLN